MAVLLFTEWKHEDKKEKTVGVTNDYELENFPPNKKEKKRNK